jgi:hypothetical protein
MFAALGWSLLNHPTFPEFCRKIGKRFRRNRQMFRGKLPDETVSENNQHFQLINLPTIGSRAWSVRIQCEDAGGTKASCQIDRIVLSRVAKPFAMIVRYTLFQHRVAVMVSDDVVVRKSSDSTSVMASSKAEADRSDASGTAPARPKRCGAMSQQRGDSSIHSQPQEFVRLVGCRDPKAGQRGGDSRHPGGPH